MRKCLACSEHITIQELLDCSKCKEHFHYSCVSVTKDYFNKNKHDLERTWLCPMCTKTTRPRRYDNTPVNSQLSPMTKNTATPIDNVTIRKKSSYPIEDTYSEDDLSLLGHTIDHEAQSSSVCQLPDTLSTTNLINQIESLLDRKLDTIKTSLLSELRSTIETVIQSQITKQNQELTSSIDILSSEQEKIKNDIEQTNNMMANLRSENLKLQNEIENLRKLIINHNNPNYKTSIGYEENNVKKIILYGLQENSWETEQDLYDRIIFAFSDILNINLEGYIEDVKRLGIRGHRRPLQIELLSKKATKEILQNRHLFKNTGLSVSEMLGPESLQVRKNLIKILIEARRNGRRAKIINNRLIIDGQEYKPDKPDNGSSHKSTMEPVNKEPIRRAQINNNPFPNHSFRN